MSSIIREKFVEHMAFSFTKETEN